MIRNLLVVGTVACLLIKGAPTVGSARLSPMTVSVGASTVVTCEISIPDPTLIAASVNLLQLNADGTTTIVGVLHDDGLNGDAAANDKIFAVALPVNVTSPGPLQFQVSAAFRGVIQRVRSSTLTVFAQPASAAQDAIAQLAQSLFRGDLPTAISGFLDADRAGEIIHALDGPGRQRLANAFATAQLVAVRADLRVFSTSWTLPSGGQVNREFALTPNSSGQWLISSW